MDKQAAKSRLASKTLRVCPAALFQVPLCAAQVRSRYPTKFPVHLLQQARVYRNRFTREEGVKELAVKPITQFPVSLDDEVR
ncbi:hypothetical protein J437_LFUL011747 [Ladona fulva]|uniref:Uncharacterized protein n=1 Tax=Ladona fulva TaxID=123851 RepID=A0A8K0KCB9_LADFU|nr:hypothetical protein J437_LFUL011747 [Ladona fulva]